MVHELFFSPLASPAVVAVWFRMHSDSTARAMRTPRTPTPTTIRSMVEELSVPVVEVELERELELGLGLVGDATVTSLDSEFGLEDGVTAGISIP